MPTLVYIHIYPDELPQNTTQTHNQFRYKSDTTLPELQRTWYISTYIPGPKIESEC